MPAGYLSLLYSTSDKPLEYWSKQKSKTGSIRRVFDNDLNERVLEIQDVEEANHQKTWIMCPPDTDQILDVKLPVLVMIIKSLQSNLLIQLQIVDTDNVRHIVHLFHGDSTNSSSLSSATIKKRLNDPSKIAPLKMHLQLEPGWNKLELDLGHLCKVFGSQFAAVTRLRLCANCRIRRLYFLDRRYRDNEISVALYQSFLDNYMTKWGIGTVERASQTKRTLAKPGARETFVMPVNSFNKLFLKNLQSKCDKIVDEHLVKQGVMPVKDYLDFKRKAKIKPYVIPERNKFKLKKSSDTSMDLGEIRKHFGRDVSMFGKLAFDKNSSSSSSRSSVPTVKLPSANADGPEVKNMIYKVYRYKYPSRPSSADKNTREAKKEAPKYSVVRK